MADNKVNFLRGTSAEYEAATKDNDTFYYTTDDGKLYLGDKEITGGGTSGGASTPISFSVSDNNWSELAEPFAGCGFKAEIVAESVSTSDYPDVFFDSTSIEAATAAAIIVNAEAGVVALYAKNKPASTLAGAYFIKKGATPE